MTVFHYRAMDEKGQVLENTLEAATTSAANAALEHRGLTPISLEEAAEDYGLGTNKSRLKLKDLAIFSRQFATLLRSGLTVSRSLETMARQSNEEHRPIFYGIQSAVDQGEPMSGALAHHSRSFSPLYVATVGAAEQVGALPVAFRQLSEMLLWEIDVRRQVRSALQYPATVIFVAFAAMIVLQQVVLPQFIKIFATLGGELPLPTKILIWSSNFTTNYWWLCLICAAGAVVGWRSFVRTPGGRLWWHRNILKIPLVGTILHRMYLARFSRIFALLQSNGLPILSAFEIIGDTIGNDEMRRHMDIIRERLQEGDSLADAVDGSYVFSPMVKNMIRVGEETGSIDESLLVVCSFYDDEIKAAINNLTQYIEPLLTFVLGGFALFLAIAIFMPWWNLNSLYK